MTIKELIEHLEKQDPTLPVHLAFDDMPVEEVFEDEGVIYVG